MNYVPLDKKKHKELKVAVDPTFAYAQKSHLAAASIREFAQLAGAMPLVVIQDPISNNHHVVAMLGLEQDQNLFLNDGKWLAPAIPMNIIRYPFDVRAEGENLAVFVDENSDLLNDKGQALFDEKEEPTDFLKSRQQFLGDLANSEMLTQRFVAKVVELDLLEDVEIRVAYENGQSRNVTGMKSINEKKLQQLDDATIVELHKAGFLGAMYAVMMSLSQLNRMVELSNKTDNPIRNMQIALTQQEGKEAAQEEKKD